MKKRSDRGDANTASGKLFQTCGITAENEQSPNGRTAPDDFQHLTVSSCVTVNDGHQPSGIRQLRSDAGIRR